jgi:hypothetical protein
VRRVRTGRQVGALLKVFCPGVEVGAQFADAHVRDGEVVLGKTTMGAQHLHEELKVEAAVGLGGRLEDLVPVEVLLMSAPPPASRKPTDSGRWKNTLAISTWKRVKRAPS